MNVSLFVTCLGDIFYPNVGKSVVEVLESLGCEVDFPYLQTCCGQPAFNSGYREEAKEAARNMIRAFENSPFVVGPSGSCVAMFSEYEELFHNDPEMQHKARSLKERSYEFTQFLVDVLRVNNVGASLNATATYHKSCHMTRLLGVKDAPEALLSEVEGLNYRKLPNCENCCGFGGTFSVKMVAVSKEMVDEKIKDIESTDADILIGADSGCLMNISGRMNRLQKPVKVMHIAEVLTQREEK
ncbi:(Fe-S)-binding protein [Guptibacillus hwajinpoensis]|uniref:L-lactate dehydrogenase complex protein LldE n=1 Tax=Guptibacillus hwajinpoensis TaxID=208199 RepID=A0ABU0K1J8_9BACL|nr:(Fe-S)-binding protein [Alkalihalobacillus hemicentroti]MDQ0483225.1 L-lactate dehydrogenase complex protein LldE [Alkalihalobacillus hemicentroti]